ncbi:MAG: DJ-1/PfpI family protein [Desulfobacterales bacterium]|nr:DJ-1/PfpI family protein [Desulfobacterales bacterium]
MDKNVHAKSGKKNLAILLFKDVEVLDFAGPFEVFSVFNELNNYERLHVYTVAEDIDTIQARNRLQVVPDYPINTAQIPDYLIIPGGIGTRALLENDTVLNWILQVSKTCDNIMSVCSGALILAKLGLLKDLSATTHHQIFDELKALEPDTNIIQDQRFTDNGKILTSAGVAAGIDMCLYMVARLYGQDQAKATARYIEYPYSF